VTLVLGFAFLNVRLRKRRERGRGRAFDLFVMYEMKGKSLQIRRKKR
jgi:hypothetical protein